MAYIVREDIKERLWKNGKTIADLSRHLEKDYNTICGYLNGRTKPSNMLILRIDGYLKDLENAPI